MWSGSNLVIMIAMKPLLGYVLHPVGVEMCREFCCQVTGKPFCVYSLTAFLCQVTRRKRLQVSDEWIILEIPTKHRAIYEATTTTCAVHTRLHRTRTRGVKCVAVSSKSKCIIGYDSGRCTCVDKPRGTSQEEHTEEHPPAKGKSSVWTEELRKDYSRRTAGHETIYIKRVDVATSWDGANNICGRDGAQLVKMDNTETVAEVTRMLDPMDPFPFKGDMWIGMRDLCDNNEYLWLDGKAPTFDNWHPDEATRYKEGVHRGKCVKMQFTFPGGKWLSTSCNSSYRYVCQLPSPDKTTNIPN